jgi:selenocysteine lyase/cysteine desulfurase
LWFAVSYPWQRSDEVVVVKGDYPSVIYPWLAQSSRGVVVRFIERREDRITPAALGKALTARTRVVALSFVQFDSGFRADLRAISAECHARGALLVVDATQGLGAVPLHVHEDGIDALGAGGYKWLLGVKGSGVFFVRQEILDILQPLHSGFGSMIHWRTPDFSSTDYPFDLAPGARRFEEGTPNVIGAVALEASLQLLARIGPARIASRIRDLTELFVYGLERNGHKVLSPRGDEEWSGIVRFRPAKGDVEGWVERFLDKRVLINARGDCLQAGLHFYNNFEEVERVISLLSSRP